MRFTGPLFAVSLLTSVAAGPTAAELDVSRLPMPLPEHVVSPGRHATAAGTPTQVAGKVARPGPDGAGERVDPRLSLSRAASRFQALRHARGLGLTRRDVVPHLDSPDAVDQLVRLMMGNGASFRGEWNATLGTPRFLAGDDLSATSLPRTASPVERAERFLADRGAVLRLASPELELRPFRVEGDPGGRHAVRFQQELHGLEVWGCDAVVRLDADGRVIGYSGHTVPTPVTFSTTPAIEASRAEEAARAVLARPAASVTGRALVALPVDGRPRLAWRVRVEEGLGYRMDVFVDARSGGHLKSVTLVHTDGGTGAASGSGVDLSGTTRNLGLWQQDGTYHMIDTSKPMFDAGASTMPNDPRGAIFLMDAQNGTSSLFHVTSGSPTGWGSFANAVSGAFWANEVYDYFEERHDRNSIDGNGMTMNLIVNFDSNFNNAFWNGQYMVFGNGDGSAFSDLAGALDVTAHEMSHGVVEHTANLVYEFQPGALNEHFADVFGAATEFHVRGAGGNWLLGEDVTTPGTAGDALRDMETPDGPAVAFGGQQPAHMDDFQDLPADTDNGGVHINSGIPNRAFFLASTASGMTVEKAADIWYEALSMYLNRNSQFVDFRLGLTQAAADLFGASSTEQNAVVAALDAVGIPTGESSDDPVDLPDIDGSDHMYAHDTSTGDIYRIDIPSIDITKVVGPIGQSGRPSVTDDGEYFAWVDASGELGAGDIQLSAYDGNTVSLSDDGSWWSVALSSDGRYLAAAPFVADGMVYVVDLLDEKLPVFPFELTVQQSSGEEVPDDILYADVMEFAVLGDYLMYDAYHQTTVSGQTYGYWDINLLRLADGISFRLFQPLPPTESIGDPTFAQNSDNRIAFDYFGGDGSTVVYGFDLSSGDLGVIVPDNGGFLGRPTFGANDTAVFFETPGTGTSNVDLQPLAGDGISADGPSEGFLVDAYWPVHFTRGTRTTPILVEGLTASWTGDDVSVAWRVPSVSGYEGFHVDRRPEGIEVYERRTAAPVAVDAGDGNGRFAFTDAAHVSVNVLHYRIMAVEADGSTVELGRLRVTRGQVPAAVPVLHANAPNPVGGYTNLRLELPEALAGIASTVRIFDVQGRLVDTPLDQAVLAPGIQILRWDAVDGSGREVAPGMYYVRLDAGGTSLTRKLVVVR